MSENMFTAQNLDSFYSMDLSSFV